MKRTALLSATLTIAGLSAVLCLATSSCNSRDAETKAGAPASSAPDKAAPTTERLVQRSGDRWKRIAKQEWIEAYDFLTPDQKKAVSVSQYIQGKSNHEYANPRVGDVLKKEKDQAYLRVSALWTPHHPQLAKVKLEPGQSLTEDIDMIETWRFVGGDWYYVRAQNEEDFFQHHPDLLKKPSDAKSPDASSSDAKPSEVPPKASDAPSKDAKSTDAAPAKPK